ncbi:hypothetical protein FVE85_4558 [Porphyridium purpureum]|uniref:VWFA domain-containing protein n=1 Tax=Porphyridium purpureum TaxID=35688 RepID=A0A5J4YI63_PORPP|nr:hypothetical protein FVE85_4558 [Porphyridium purpureum]|eukprot:POR7013..scf297_16
MEVSAWSGCGRTRRRRTLEMERERADGRDGGERVEEPLQLPVDVFREICAFLDLQALLELQCVSRAYRRALERDQSCWRRAALHEIGAFQDVALCDRAAVLAGGWKQLLRESGRLNRRRNHHWDNACDSELRAAAEMMLHCTRSWTQSRPGAKTAGVYEPALCSLPRDDTCSSTSSVSSHEDSHQHRSAHERSGGIAVRILVLMDGSSSISDEDFSSMKRYVVRMLEAAAEEARRQSDIGFLVSVIQFNQTCVVELPFVRVEENADTLVQRVLSISQLMGSTDIPLALFKAEELLRNLAVDVNSTENASERRTKCEDIVVLLSDGQMRQEESLWLGSFISETLGAVFCAAGVGRDVDEHVLSQLVQHGRQNLRAHGHGVFFLMRKWRDTCETVAAHARRSRLSPAPPTSHFAPPFNSPDRVYGLPAITPMSSTAAFLKKMGKGGDMDPETFLKMQQEAKEAKMRSATASRLASKDPAAMGNGGDGDVPGAPPMPRAPSALAAKPASTVKRVEKKVRTLPPEIKAGDSEEVIALKKKIKQTEAEIQDMLRKMAEYNERLERIVLIVDAEKLENLTPA